MAAGSTIFKKLKRGLIFRKRRGSVNRFLGLANLRLTHLAFSRFVTQLSLNLIALITRFFHTFQVNI